MKLYNDITEITNITKYEAFKNHVLTMIGDGLISVELEDEQIVAAFYRAKEIYKQRGSNPDRRQFILFDVEKGKREYDLPVNNIETIANIIQTRGGFRSEDPFTHSIVNNFLFHKSGQLDMIVYDLTIQQVEQLKKYSAFYTQWIHHYYDNKIELLKEPHADETWFIEAYTNYSDEEFMDMTWVQRYTIAEAKGILGRAYRKFSTLTTPAGDVQLDGDQLVQESNEEKEQLIEDIKNLVDSGRPTGYGIFMG